MNHWAIKQKVQLISTLSRFFLSQSIFFIYLLYSRAAQKKVVRVCIFTHTLLQTPEIQQYLFQQSHLSKRPTSSRYATPFTSEPCEIASHLFPRPKGYVYSWKRPTVIRSLGRGYKKAGPHCCPLLCIQDNTTAGKWAPKLWLCRLSVGTLLGNLFPAQIRSGKERKNENCIHICS